MIDEIELKRLSVNKIYGKSKGVSEPYSEDAHELCKLDFEGQNILAKRILNCVNHRSKFFELTLEDDSKDSCFELQKKLTGLNNSDFLKATNSIANLAAASHKTGNIPDGLILSIEAKFRSFEGVIIVKAEKSDAFSAGESGLSLVKDIFLSSDKTLYKVGFFVRTSRENLDKKSFKFFVYDDAFTPSKDDLAAYFYRKFLGLSTEENGKIQTNNLCKDLLRMSNEYIQLSDRGAIEDKIAQIFHNPKKITLSASDFKDIFPSELDTVFESEIEANYPYAFEKDNSIVNVLEKRKIALSENAIVTLKNWQEGILTGSTGRPVDFEKLKTTIDSGSNYNFLLIPSMMPSFD